VYAFTREHLRKRMCDMWMRMQDFVCSPLLCRLKRSNKVTLFCHLTSLLRRELYHPSQRHVTVAYLNTMQGRWSW